MRRSRYRLRKRLDQHVGRVVDESRPIRLALGHKHEGLEPLAKVTTAGLPSLAVLEDPVQEAVLGEHYTECERECTCERGEIHTDFLVPCRSGLSSPITRSMTNGSKLVGHFGVSAAPKRNFVARYTSWRSSALSVGGKEERLSHPSRSKANPTPRLEREAGSG
jgi:hypothetical protein